MSVIQLPTLRHLYIIAQKNEWEEHLCIQELVLVTRAEADPK